MMLQLIIQKFMNVENGKMEQILVFVLNQTKVSFFVLQGITTRESSRVHFEAFNLRSGVIMTKLSNRTFVQHNKTFLALDDDFSKFRFLKGNPQKVYLSLKEKQFFGNILCFFKSAQKWPKLIMWTQIANNEILFFDAKHNFFLM